MGGNICSSRNLLFPFPERCSGGDSSYFWGYSCCRQGHSSTGTTTATAAPPSCASSYKTSLRKGKGYFFWFRSPLRKSLTRTGTPNLSQIHPVNIGEEGLPSCPIISPYISKLSGASYTPSHTSGFGELAGIPEE